MTSPKEEAEALVNDLLPFAKKMLTEHGEFHPFGGFMKTTNEIVHVGATDPDTEYPRPADLIDLMKRDFRRRALANEIKAAAVVFDVSVSPPRAVDKVDAIQVSVEHSGSFCAEVFFPYSKNAKGELAFGEVFAQAGTRSLFES